MGQILYKGISHDLNKIIMNEVVVESIGVTEHDS